MTGSDRRLMLVHAHPDDESSQTALAMAKYAREGAQVTLVTATLGEQGEIVADRLKQLTPPQLAEHRLGELAKATAELGVRDHVRLGGDFHYQDSGMAYADDGSVIAAPDTPDEAFARADLRTAADLLVELIRDRRPQVLTCYDDFGGYGHPDHIQAHRVSMYATQLAAIGGYRPDLGDPWQVSRVFWSAFSDTDMRTMIRTLRAAGDTESFAELDPDADELPMAIRDELIDVTIDAPQLREAQLAALRAHESQIDFDDGFFAALQRADAWGREHYRLAAGQPVPRGSGDLFAGLTEPAERAHG